MTVMFVNIAFVLVGLFVLEVSADSCCGETDCPDSCPWNDSCQDGHDFNCMDKVSGAMKCRDSTVCRTFEDCDESAAAYRSGQMCRSFPWFNGGYPFDPVKFDNEVKWFSCKDSSTELFCDKWSTLGDSIDEMEVGAGECDTPSANGEYCNAWTEVTKEYKKCWWGQYINDDGRSSITEVCCSEKNKHQYPCCTQTCDASTYDARPPEIETAVCQCVEAEEEGRYCQKWTCEETSDISYLSNHDTTEYETYTCVSSRPISNSGGASSLEQFSTVPWEDSLALSDADLPRDALTVTSGDLGGGKYCSRWLGDIESIEEFELAKCTCLEESTAGNYCQRWTCFEKGTDFWWPNLGWLAFTVVMVALGQGVGVVVLNCEDFTIPTRVVSYVSICLVWGGSFTVIGIWKCGLLCLFVYLAQCYVLPLLVYWAYYVRTGQWPMADKAASAQAGKLDPSDPSAPPVVATELKQWESRPYSLVSAELATPVEDCSNQL